MMMNNREFTILHVEDNAIMANLVRAAFASFGFRGSIITAGRVDEALALLDERERNREPVNLILTDIKLPDGTGLEVIREVKTNPARCMTPVIVLSGELAPGMIAAAYALGANCYVSKIPGTKGVLESLRTLYAGWLESALLPQDSRRDRLRDILSRAVHLRARTAEFYLALARVFEGTPETGFWIDRALNEGNMANLLAFFQPILTEDDLNPETIDRLASMQVQVQLALKTAEECLRKTTAPSPAEVFRWVLKFMGALDEEVVAEVIGCLFPKGPEATAALKARAACQMRELACHILERTEETDLRRQSEKMLDWSGKITV